MRRLEYTRRARGMTGHARNAAEAVTHLAHVARERHRLVQERRSVARRLGKIDNRLAAIAETETKLMPMLQKQANGDEIKAIAPPRSTPPPLLLPAGLSSVTLQY